MAVATTKKATAESFSTMTNTLFATLGHWVVDVKKNKKYS
jgi:hypothetical protein